MGSPGWAPLLLLAVGLCAPGGIVCCRSPCRSTHSLLALHTARCHCQESSLTGSPACAPCSTLLALLPRRLWHVPVWHLRVASDASGLQRGCFCLSAWKSRKSYMIKFCRRPRMPAPAQRRLLGRHCLSGKGHHLSVPCPDTCHRGLRSKRTQPWDPDAAARRPGLGSPRRGGPDFSFELLPEARVIRATVPPGPEVHLRLCHQWALECEEPSSPFDAQKIVSGGHTADLPYEFLLPCLCIEAFHLQEDTVRHKKCPFQSWPEAYGSDFWESVHFSDYSQRDQMAMALTLRCPLRLEASLCQKQEGHTLCEDIPNATARESEGWYILDKVDLHPQLCFKFSVGNSSHVECPHQTAGACTSWNVSMETRARQLILHFSSMVQAAFSAAWSHPGLGHDPLMSPVYSVSQTQGSGPVALDLVIPFLRPGGCVLVWRSDVQFALKRLLCPDVSHRRLGLSIVALLALATLLGMVLALTRCHPLSGPGPARPVLLLHAAESQEQRRLVGALAELLRTALGGGRDVIVDLWEGTRVAHMGPLPWLWAAHARVVRERGTVLLLWGPAGGCDPRTAPLHALLRAAPRPLLLLAYFSRLCAKGDIPRPLRVLPRYRLLRDLPRLLRALGARPCTAAAGPGCPGARQGLRGRLELCRRLEREAATVAGHV